MDINFKIENNFIPSLNKNMNQNDENEALDNNIIILDDDDFIQTTFNLLSKNTSPSCPPSCLSIENHTHINNPSSENNSTIQNSSSTNYFNSDSNASTNNILIDLTCDDFDLNDLFMLHSNNEFSNQTFNSNNNNNNSNQQNNSVQQQDVATIKNEFDFKVFNFNIKDFTSCIEEILIDDDDDEEMFNVEIPNELMSQQQQQQQEQQPTISDFNSFKNYRNTNDSSSDTSCTTKNSSHNHRTNNVYKCDQCSKTFNKSFNYKRHMFVHSSTETSENNNNNNNNSVYKRVPNECQNCKRRILDKSNFAKHLKLCNQKMLTKKIKYFSYPTQTSSNELETTPVFNHKKNIVNRTTKVTSTTFCCELCNKIFNKKFNYHRHIRMHFLNEIMNHQHDPSNEYRTSTVVAVASAAGIRPHFFACNSCPRKFNENKQLILHQQKWHLNVFECEYCTMDKPKFSGKFDYIKHLNVAHKMHFKFKCKYCCKYFKFMSQYIQHRQNHLIKNRIDEENDFDEEETTLNESPKCKVCGRIFSSVFNLKRHVNARHPDLSRNDNCDKGDDGSSNQLFSQANNNSHNSSIKLKFDCNTNQKNFYERNKLNFHLNKIQLNK